MAVANPGFSGYRAMIILALGFLAAAGSFSAAAISPALSLAALDYHADIASLTGWAATAFQFSLGLGHLWWGVVPAPDDPQPV